MNTIKFNRPVSRICFVSVLNNGVSELCGRMAAIKNHMKIVSYNV